MKSTKPKNNEFQYIDIDSIDNKQQIINEIKTIKTPNAPSRGGIDKALDIFHPRNIRTYIKTLGNDPETRQILSAEFQNLMEAAKRTRMQPGDAKTLPEGK